MRQSARLEAWQEKARGAEATASDGKRALRRLVSVRARKGLKQHGTQLRKDTQGVDGWMVQPGRTRREQHAGTVRRRSRINQYKAD